MGYGAPEVERGTARGPAASSPVSHAPVPHPLSHRPMPHVPRVVVAGLGNVLVGDDALGPWVVRTLEARFELPPSVTVIEGTPGNDLVPHLMGADAVIVADTVTTRGAPGTIVRYRRDEILRTPPALRVNPHQPGLKDSLFTLELLGEAPGEVLLVGVIPEVLETGLGLSPSVRAAVDRVVDEVVRELARLGLPATPRADAPPVHPWWEAS